ncbi:DNA polymerase I [Tissierella creatinophila]|uniref:DNA polymerase I n=1 Tax=Tissierella creatinophila DSM 6911 TaxID=1123403 RepID=A0A1U7M7W8_TISCR|nr:DNA polymerase I [Tissierella creatinophila]OLS03309.1 DNA polymerase I [Tissierella creatinophila DSM 6911]
MDNKKLMIIDGSSLLHRAFYALPLLTTKEGVYTNGVYGFLTMLYRIKEEYDPGYICVAFDKKGPTFRHKEYKEYKGTRDKSPTELAQQFPIIRETLNAMNIVVLEMDEYEADDIAGTLAKMGESQGLETILVTGDKDYLQLATDNTKVLITRKGITELEIFDRAKIEEVYGITPAQLIDLKGLMGDKSDNIPGVPGIGEKTGLKLIKEFKNIEGVYENIDNISGKKLKENLIENETIAYLSRRLGEIITNVPLDSDIEGLKTREPDFEELLKIYESFEFKSLISKIPSEYSQIEEVLDFDIEHNDITSEDFSRVVDLIEKKNKFAFKFLIDNWNYIEDSILAVAIKVEGEPTFYIDLKDSLGSFIESFKDVFQSEKIEKLGYSLKDDIIVLFRLHIQIENYIFDPKIAQYLINPSQSEYSINNLSQEYINYYGIDEEALLGKGKKKKNFNDITEEERRVYLSYMLQVTFKLEDVMMDILRKQNMEELYKNVENPLIEVLANMEYIGFKIDKEELISLGEKYSNEIETLTSEIYELSEVEFNINSPKQMGEILFDKLELPVIKKTKTGYSTNVEVLEKLQGKHPIIDKILRYRQIVKLKSTYIDGYLNLINPKNGRIHSSFNQTITTTGRISSTEPNLQNIPIRTEDGKMIRKAFVASDENHILVDADYSQIELRVLAHISKDEKMIEAFKEKIDIHSKTASEVFHVPLNEVTPTLRSNAKAVNFGIVYGISDYGLSRDLNISRKEAKEYIDNYLENYKGIRKFMVDIVEEGKENGFVETLLHRRRYIPELQAKNFNVRSFGERIAMNTPIQGSAADIIKMAMVEVYDALKTRGLKSKLILQVHDELIIETIKEELDDVKSIMKDIMESAIKLDVPLKVDIEVGDSWYDTH